MNDMEDYSWLNSWLSPGEQILWRGKPEKYSLFEKNDILLIPFSIFWCGFAIYWEYTAFAKQTPLLFRLWGIPFVCVGLYFVIGRFSFRSYLLRHSAYAITDRKIIRKFGKKVEMLQSNSLPPMQVEQKEDGSGTIRFPVQKGYWRNSFNHPADSSDFTLVGLSDVRRAVSAIEAMRSCDDRL